MAGLELELRVASAVSCRYNHRMSITYLVSPLDPQMLEWALKCSVPAHGMTGNGRAATLDELKEVAASIRAHSFSVRQEADKFSIEISSEKTVTFPIVGSFANTVAPGVAVAPAWSTLINGAHESSGAIRWMSFHGDMVLLVMVVRTLTRTCGPQVMYADCDGVPWIISSADAVPIGPEPWLGTLPEAEHDADSA